LFVQVADVFDTVVTIDWRKPISASYSRPWSALRKGPTIDLQILHPRAKNLLNFTLTTSLQAPEEYPRPLVQLLNIALPHHRHDE
jgi:hypothetical protein